MSRTDRRFKTPSKGSIRAAIQINRAWLKCAISIDPEKCPSDEQVAAMIEEHGGFLQFMRDVEAALKRAR